VRIFILTCTNDAYFFWRVFPLGRYNCLSLQWYDNYMQAFKVLYIKEAKEMETAISVAYGTGRDNLMHSSLAALMAYE
jgi:hypothetical protein